MDRRVLVIGLDCVPPELAFERLLEHLPTIRNLMKSGAYGCIESVIPPITVPAWACMMTGKSPGDLGVYGFRHRKDYSYQLSLVSSHSMQQKAVWDYLSEAGKESIVIGVPPAYPPKPLKGAMISCFLTPSTQAQYTYPPQLKAELENLVGEYLFDVKDFRTEDKAGLLKRIYELTEQRFKVVKHLMTTKPWDFFMFVEMGPDRLHHGFWKYADPQHIKYEPGNPFENALLDYYRFLDAQLAELLMLVDENTVVIVVSDHGAKRLDGGICVNEWLMREGYLRLKQKPTGVTPLEQVEIDWERTVAWAEGGYYGRVTLNVKGREPLGIVTPSEYEKVRDELVAKLEALGDEHGQSIGTRVYKPEELYSTVRGIAPDLIVLFGDLYWRSVGSIGFDTVWVHENDTGPDDANHAMHGIFIITGVNGLKGELKGLQITDIAGMLLNLFELPHDLRTNPVLSGA